MIRNNHSDVQLLPPLLRLGPALCLLLLLGVGRPTLAAVLTHRYSFDGNASDSIGGADGSLQGNALITNGALVLDGTNSALRLPDDLFTNDDSVSFEMWFATGALTSPNARLYSFSGTNGALSLELDGQGIYVVGAASNVVSLPAPAVAGTVHMVWSQDSSSHTARLYVNGLLASENTNFALTPAGIGSTTNDCIGGIGSPSTVADFQGGILEFRAYRGALTPLEVAVADALGPNQTPLDPGTLLDIRMVAPPPAGPGALIRATVYADFVNATNVNISGQPDLLLTSDNTNVIVIAPDQRLRTVGLGTANITAHYLNLSDTVPLTINVPQDVALLHRYSFNERTNDWIVHDSVGQQDGWLVGNPDDISFTGSGELNLIGYPVASGAYAALPGGLISGLSEVSMEAWVTWTGGQGILGIGHGAWQRIFDFGNQQSGDGYGSAVTYFFLTPATDPYSMNTIGISALHATITTNSIDGETPRLDWTNRLPPNVASFVAVTYSPVRGVMKMYLNGLPVASGTATIPLSGIIDTNDWLGRSQYASDSYFSGYYNEFRIYRGLLSDADVAADYQVGPNVVGVDYILHEFASGNSLTITWGLSTTNWFLESTPALGTDAVWTQVLDTAAIQDGRYRVTLPVTAKAGYYRLHAP